MPDIHPSDLEGLAKLGGKARLILNVGLPRLAARADEVAAAIDSFDPKRPVEFSRRAAAIPGAEALSVVARLAEPQRKHVLASLDVPDEARRRLAEAIHKIGDPEDHESVAAALQRLAPDADLSTEPPADRAELHAEAWKVLEARLRNACDTGDLGAAAAIMGQIGVLAAKDDKREVAETWFRKAIDALPEVSDPILLGIILASLANLLRTWPGRLAEARGLAEEALDVMLRIGPEAVEIWKVYNMLADIVQKTAHALADDRNKETLLAQARQYFRLAREARRNLPGIKNVLQNHGALIASTVLTTEDRRFSPVLEVFLSLAEQRGSVELARAIRRILKGERDAEALCEYLDSESSMIVEAILRGIADPSKLKNLMADTNEEPTRASDQ